MESAEETESKIKETVIEIMKKADMGIMTEFKVRNIASEKLGINLSVPERKQFVRCVVESFLLSKEGEQPPPVAPPPPPPAAEAAPAAAAEAPPPTEEIKTKGTEEKEEEAIETKPEIDERDLDEYGDNIICRLSSKRRVTVQDFKGKTLVSIREYFQKDGKHLPSSRGISLTNEQWSAFRTAVPAIEEAIKKMESKLGVVTSTDPSITSENYPASRPSSPSTFATTTMASSTPVIPFTELHAATMIKLDHNNFLLWKAQFLSYFEIYDLEKFIDGTSKCPSAKTDAGASNPDYLEWIHTDRHLLGWFIFTMTEPIFSQVKDCSSSHDMWQKLANIFTAKSDASIIHIKQELQHLNKGNMPMADYIAHAKRLADALAAAGQPISEREIRRYIINGLDSFYEPIVGGLLTNMRNDSFGDFDSDLISYDLRVAANNRKLLSQPQANVAKAFRGRDVSMTANGNPAIICQICERPYHNATDCWKRFDKNYKPSKRQPPKRNNSRSSFNTNSSPLAAYVVNQQTNLTDWLTDSGATNHMTNNLSNLQNHYEYQGLDQVRTAGGNNL